MPARSSASASASSAAALRFAPFAARPLGFLLTGAVSRLRSASMSASTSSTSSSDSPAPAGVTPSFCGAYSSESSAGVLTSSDTCLPLPPRVCSRLRFAGRSEANSSFCRRLASAASLSMSASGVGLGAAELASSSAKPGASRFRCDLSGSGALTEGSTSSLSLCSSASSSASISTSPRLLLVRSNCRPIFEKGVIFPVRIRNSRWLSPAPR